MGKRSSIGFLASMLVLTACQRGSPPGNVQRGSPQAALSSEQPPASPDAAHQQAPSAATSGRAANPTPAATSAKKTAPKPHLTEEDSMINLDAEGGTRGAKYALWVHALRDGKTLQGVRIMAYDQQEQKVAAAVTGRDGYARLLVSEGNYRVTAILGDWHAAQSVNFQPGQDVVLELSK